MNDYDLPIISTDKEILKENGFIQQDSQMNDLVAYKGILNKVAPPERVDARNLVEFVLKVQTNWRAYTARKNYKIMQKEQEDTHLRMVKDQVKGLNGRKQLQKSPSKEEAKQAPKGKMTPAEMAKKKATAAKAGIQARKEQFTLEKKIGAVVKPVRDAKAAERAMR